MSFPKKYFRIILLVLSGAIATFFVTGALLAANLLVNGAFETFQDYEDENGPKAWRGFPEKYGTNWTLEVISEDGLHFMDSYTFGQFASDIYGVPFLNYRIEGDYSQAFASRRGFDFVFKQTVSVSPGLDYALGGKVVTYWKGPGDPQDSTKIFKRIGIDWTGGTNHTGPNVVWTAWDSTDNAWVSPALAGTAAVTHATVFIQVDNRGEDVGPAYLSSGHIDNFRFERAPIANIILPAQTAPGDVNVTWDVTIPDPGFWSLWGYDVQMKDSVNPVWQTIQIHDANNGVNTDYQFTAEAGKTYSFRVRPWQEWGENGDPATTALPGVWQEASITTGGAVLGRVINHMGLGLKGVTVSVSGTSTSTTSLDGGQYFLPVGSAGTFTVIATNTGGLTAPPATNVTVPTATSNGQLDIMLRPAGPTQAITNGDFETDLTGWNTTGPTNVSGPGHTGQQSLLISETATVSQTGVVTNVFNPLLSFWYKGDAAFQARLMGQTAAGNQITSHALESLAVITLPLASEWTLVTLEAGIPEQVSGELGVQFTYNGESASIFIDEVSIATGPRKIFLPIVLKQ